MTTTADNRPHAFGLERIQLPARQAHRVKLPMKVREAMIELSGEPTLRRV